MAFQFNMQFFALIILPMITIVIANQNDPLSDEFIVEINKKATTWKVITTPSFSVEYILFYFLFIHFIRYISLNIYFVIFVHSELAYH